MRRTIIFALAALPLAGFGGAVWWAEAYAPPRNVASVEIMQRLQDEHAQVADYIRMDSEARRRAYANADQEAAALRQAALEQNRQRIAQAETVAKAERRTTTARTAIRIEPAAPVGAPMTIAPAAQVAAAPQLEEGPVRSRLRELASDMKRFPGWFSSAAAWMADETPSLNVPSLKVPSLPLLRLPGRQFRAEM